MYILRNLEEEAYGESTSEEEYEDTTAPPPSEQNPPKTTSNLPTSTSSLLYGAPAFEKEEAESENPLFEGVVGTPQVQAAKQFQDVAMNKLANYDYFHVRMCSHLFTSIESIYTVYGRFTKVTGGDRGKYGY